MNFQDFKNHVQKVRIGLSGLFQKVRVEPEYRRLGILAVVFLAATTLLSPFLGIALVLIAVWYLTY